MSFKRLLAVLVVAAFASVVFNASAEGDKAAPAGHKELTLTGKLILKEDVKGEVKATDKVGKTEEKIEIAGKETIVCKYALETADGEVALPEPPKVKEGEKAIDMAAMIGKTVKVVAKGTEKEHNGKKVIKVKQIVSVTEEAAPAAAPAAPAAQ